jgi:hypothetical protein
MCYLVQTFLTTSELQTGNLTTIQPFLTAYDGYQAASTFCTAVLYLLNLSP